MKIIKDDIDDGFPIGISFNYDEDMIFLSEETAKELYNELGRILDIN